MRTVEVLFVIMILLSAFVITSQFAVLPSPREAFGTNLRDLSQSTLDVLDAQGVLSQTVFSNSVDDWGDLQKALSASLPPNIVYNLTVYDILTSSDGVVTYDLTRSISDATFEGDSDSASLLVASPNVTFTEDPQKIGESSGQNITLYILNCNDANGWWITGYTGQSLAMDFYNLLSPYFQTTVLLNSTADFQDLLNNSPGLEGDVQNAVVINTFGESVPITYQIASAYSGDYSSYCYFLGQTVNNYNWTWVSIVGYPLYYVSNTNYFAGSQAWGIYGMNQVGEAGLNSFVMGLTGESFTGDMMEPVSVVQLSSNSLQLCNYYGIYPSPHQTSSRALNEDILVDDCGLIATELFDRPDSPNDNFIPAATYKNIESSVGKGALTAIGLTRTPDVRMAVLALLMYYKPSVYRSEFGASGTSRLVTLQLSQQGGN
jgi:hypothetical protein